MEDHAFNSAAYGTITIKCRNKVWKELSDQNCENLAAVVNGQGREHLSSKSRGEPGEGALGYVHDYGTNQIASYKDVESAPKSITVMKIGKVNAGTHVW